MIIVCGHGHFASGLASAARLLGHDDCTAIDFTAEVSLSELKMTLEEALAQAGTEPILFLTDILGGTPYRECANLALKHENAEVISGANLPVLMEALLNRSRGDMHAHAAQLIAQGKACLTALSERLAESPLGGQHE